MPYIELPDPTSNTTSPALYPHTLLDITYVSPDTHSTNAASSFLEHTTQSLLVQTDIKEL